MNWQNGRQPATKDLQKLLLFKGKSWDCYLIKIPKDKHIDWHYDKIEGKEHHRFNLTIWGIWTFWRAKEIQKNWIEQSYQFCDMFSWQKFRPDIEEHMARIYSNTWILSIGWTK